MNKTKLVTDSVVQTHLQIPALIPLMGNVLQDVSSGAMKMLPRNALFQENGNIFALMSASLPRFGVCGCKAAIFPGPTAAAAGTTQSVVLLFSIETGALLGVVAAEHITVARTAATTAAATDVLAKPDASVLCLMGAGNQAIGHAQSICAIRPIQEIRVWDIFPEGAERACECLRAQYPGVSAVPVLEAEQAVRGADIVCTVSKAKDPILFGDWLAPGAHVNAVGACSPVSRELDLSVLKRGRVYVDQMEVAMASAGDLLVPMKAGQYAKEEIVGEVGAVANGTCPGRAAGDRETVTVFETCGLAAQDVAAAYTVMKDYDGEDLFTF